MKRLPVGRQNFEEIIKENLLYVDKTRQIFELMNRGKLYFLSRPRRFGKSLLISLFKHLFSGKKDLFKGLYIHDKTDYDWQSYPVLQFNFAKLGQEVEDVYSAISYVVKSHAEDFNIELPQTNLSLQFDYLVRSISEQSKPVVILIDEYDKPIIDFLGKKEQALKNRTILKEFFSPLKDLDAQGHLKFLFITGVSKFSKVSLFSDLNNLTDLTIDPLSHDLVGITHPELLANFQDYIKRAAQHFKASEEEILKDIKIWYNGYAFNPAITLYNPFSLLNFFSKNHFGNFWFATGTPTFLVNSIRDKSIEPKDFENVEVPETFFDRYSLEDLDVTGLLFQTGYLTIKETRTKRRRTTYFLGYPNEEVRVSMMHNLVEAFTYKTTSIVGNALLKMERGLEEGKVELFVEQLEILLSDISYHLIPRKKRDKRSEFEVWEGYFQTIIYLVTSFMGFHVQSEITKHKGRLDLLVETDDFLYIMEFKLDEPSKNAIQQIKDRQYAAAYKNSSKTVYLVGIGFSKEERNVEEWKAEIWKQ